MPLAVDKNRCPQNHRCPLVAMCPVEPFLRMASDCRKSTVRSASNAENV